jgi:hypothetical protein
MTNKDRKEMEVELEKAIGKSIRSLLQNNHEIINKMILEVAKEEVKKVLQDILGATVRKRVTDIIYAYRDKIVQDSQATILITEGGDSDLKDIDNVTDAKIAKEEVLYPKPEKQKQQHQ